MRNVTPTDQLALQRVQWLARLLDDSIPIPGTSYRIGLDALIGLVPGLGDLIGGALATYLVAIAVDRGVPRATVARMAVNVLIEVGLGAVPLAGDVFDAAWKANARNARLLEAAMVAGKQSGRKDAAFLAVVVLGLGAAVLAAATGGVWLLLQIRELLIR